MTITYKQCKHNTYAPIKPVGIAAPETVTSFDLPRWIDMDSIESKYSSLLLHAANGRLFYAGYHSYLPNQTLYQKVVACFLKTDTNTSIIKGTYSILYATAINNYPTLTTTAYNL